MTREEAIEVVRKNLPHLGIGATEMTDALGTLIPELAESEDEGERIRKWLVYYFKAIGKSWLRRDISIEQILAYLEKQKEQKPEWSEEDERVLKGIIGLVDHDQHYGVSNKEMISWLKSLRPSWKPSEEQMKALEAATVRYQSTGLESLYEDLKKVM